MITKFSLKGLLKMINKNAFHLVKSKFQKTSELSQFFNQDSQLVYKIVKERLMLLSDYQLNTFVKLSENSYEETNEYFQRILDDLTHEIKVLLEMDLFQYRSSYWWIKKLNLVQGVINMLNNLFSQSNNSYLDLYKKFIEHYTDAIILLGFLVAVFTSSWEEAIRILDQEQTDLLSNQFEEILSKLKEKISKKIIFFNSRCIVDTKELQNHQSNVSMIVTLFMKNLYFNSFKQLRFSDQPKSFSNSFKIHLQKHMDLCAQSLFKNFFRQLDGYSYDEKAQISQEIKIMFSSDIPTIKRSIFHMINPLEALDLDNNQVVFSPNFKTQIWIKILDDFILQSLLENEYAGQSEKHFKERREFFRQGIEIFKSKVEHSAFKVGSQKVIT